MRFLLEIRELDRLTLLRRQRVERRPQSVLLYEINESHVVVFFRFGGNTLFEPLASRFRTQS